jgi:hypothetical protein
VIDVKHVSLAFPAFDNQCDLILTHLGVYLPFFKETVGHIAASNGIIIIHQLAAGQRHLMVTISFIA